jgi:hypothetical protein
MQRILVQVAMMVAVGAALGCAPDSLSPDGGAGSGGGGGAGGGGGSAPVTYTKDVQPILMAKCAPCHTGQGLGGHNLGTTYADAFKPVMSLDAMGCWNDAEMTMPKKIGECALISIMNGWMPMSMGCFNSPRPPECVSQAQQDVITAWVAAGMPQ